MCPSRQPVVVVAAATALLTVSGSGCLRHVAGGPIEAGFWFEEVTFESARLGSPLAADDVRAIEAVARAELADAFRGLPIVFTDRRNARYTVRVEQKVLDPRFRRHVGVAGQSRGIAGFGGTGSVSFDFLANGAMSYAPDDADRATLVAAIGRGIGRTAVHEFTHQLLPTAGIHDSRDDQSYEFQSAARRAQYFGPMRWERAWPALQQTLSRRAAFPG